MKIRNVTETPTIDQRSVTVLNNFSFRINFSYRIGKMTFEEPRRRGRSINNDDLKEGGGGDMGGGGMEQGGGNMGGGQRGGGAVVMGGAGAQRPQQASGAKPAAIDSTKIDLNAVVVAEGNWNYTLESPQGGGGTLKIVKDGENYTGTIINSRNNREVALKSVTVKGNELSFSYENSFGGNTMEITTKGIITGKEFAGTMTVGQFGAFPIKATRTE
jgi:hypothetical protein